MLLHDHPYKPICRVLELFIPTLPVLVTDFNPAVGKEAEKSRRKLKATAGLSVNLPPPTADVCDFFFVCTRKEEESVREPKARAVVLVPHCIVVVEQLTGFPV